MKHIKTYLSGLLIILTIVQPWYVGKLIGASSVTDCWIVGVFIEILVFGILYTPYIIGKKING